MSDYYKDFEKLAQEFEKAADIAQKQNNSELVVSYKNAANYIRENYIKKYQKCSSYYINTYEKFNMEGKKEYIEVAECWGTSEREKCFCDGDRSKCTFY